MLSPPLSEAKHRLLDYLKRGGPSKTANLAADLQLTKVAVRQHLANLDQLGLVESRTLEPAGRGRPSILWSVTAAADTYFPDRHSDLTLELLAAMRQAFGEEGVDRLIEVRTEQQTQAYHEQLERLPLGPRVQHLAELRTAEGYMAEASEISPGEWQLIERHCPICTAATACQGLCRAELEVFQNVLGPKARVQRDRHLLSGDDRCAYRITVLDEID